MQVYYWLVVCFFALHFYVKVQPFVSIDKVGSLFLTHSPLFSSILQRSQVGKNLHWPTFTMIDKGEKCYHWCFSEGPLG